MNLLNTKEKDKDEDYLSALIRSRDKSRFKKTSKELDEPELSNLSSKEVIEKYGKKDEAKGKCLKSQLSPQCKD